MLKTKIFFPWHYRREKFLNDLADKIGVSAFEAAEPTPSGEELILLLPETYRITIFKAIGELPILTAKPLNTEL